MKTTLLTIILLFAGLLIYINPVNAENSSLILFWGDGCPHCAMVKEEIKRKEIDQKISIDYKEIYYSEDNANLFNQKIRECGISPFNVGVPLIYIDGSCWVGTDEIIYSLEKEIAENEYNYENLDNNKEIESQIVDEQFYENNLTFPFGFTLSFSVVLIIGISIYLVWRIKRK